MAQYVLVKDVQSYKGGSGDVLPDTIVKGTPIPVIFQDARFAQFVVDLMKPNMKLYVVEWQEPGVDIEYPSVLEMINDLIANKTSVFIQSRPKINAVYVERCVDENGFIEKYNVMQETVENCLRELWRKYCYTSGEES